MILIMFYSNFGNHYGFHTDSSTGGATERGLCILIMVVTENKIKYENENEVGAKGIEMT